MARRTRSRITGNRGEVATTPLIVTIIVLVVGTGLFFIGGAYKQSDMGNAGIYGGIRYKAAYTPTGEIKLFANAKESELAKLKVTEGKSVPTESTLVIGAAEADMMHKENLFAKVGDSINGLFGIDATVGGILKPTNTSIDDTHFLSHEQFEELNGEEGRVFVKLNEQGMPKLFYRLQQGEATPLKLELAEGEMSGYRNVNIGGTTYHPILIGASEAKMMREEKLFQKPGDTIKGFFGRDVVVVGIIKQNNTSLDMMHVMPLPSEALA